MVRIKFRSKEACERRRLFIKRIIVVLIILIILITVGTVLFLRMERIQIRETNIEGTNIIDKEEVNNIVNTSLSGNYLWLIPKSNTFLYSLKDLNNNLIKKFPGIYSLNINREGFKKISIEIEERKPQALWCKDGNEEIPECYFVDSTGKVFASAPYFSGNVYFIYKGELSKEDPLGAQIFIPEDFSLFQIFIKQIKSKLELSIVGVELKNQGDFDLLLSSGTKIMLNKKNSYEDMYNNIDTILKSQQLSSSNLDSIDYIDMRFGNKVYYKAKSAPKF